MRTVIVAATALSVCGCASLNTSGSTVTVQSAPSTDVDRIQVLTGVPDKPFQELALVSAYSYGGLPGGDLAGAESAALAELKRRAASAGADAVVKLRRATLTDQGVRYSPWYPIAGPVTGSITGQAEQTAPGVSATGQAGGRAEGLWDRATALVTSLFESPAVLLRGSAVKLK